jgi:hypothetical protein
MLGSSAAILLSLEASPGERWFVAGSGLAFLGLLGVAFFFAAIRPSAIYPSPFWPRARIEQLAGHAGRSTRARKASDASGGSATIMS